MKEISRNNFIGHGLFLLFTLVFIAYKWEHLHLPYFWDESWVYAPAVKTLARHGASLLPAALDPEFSRGHPLFFHFLGALWINIWGESLVSLHSFALFLSILLAYFTFYFTSKFTKNQITGSFSALLLYAQGIFIAQSAMVLPEVFLSLLILLAFWFYIQSNYLALCISLSIGLQTKESFLIAFGILAGFELLSTIQKIIKKQFRFSFKKLLCFLIPILLLFIFFLFQKSAYGWYLYPTHLGMIKWEQWSIAYNLRTLLDFAFLQQGRFVLFYLSLFLSLYVFIKKDNKTLIIALIAFAFFVWFLVFKEKYTSTTWLPLSASICFLSWVFLIIMKEKPSGQFYKFSLLAMGFSMAYSSFCVINFFSIRYITCLIPLFIVYSVVVLSKFSKKRPIFVYVFLFFCSGYTLFENHKPLGIGDVELSFLPALKTQQELVKYCEKSNFYKLPIYAPFLDNNNLGQPLSGFKSNSDIFERIHGHYTPKADSILIFNNIEKDFMKDSILRDGDYKLIKVIENEMVKSEIYRYQGSGNK